MDIIAFLERRINMWRMLMEETANPEHKVFAEGKVNAYLDVLREVKKGYLEV